MGTKNCQMRRPGAGAPNAASSRSREPCIMHAQAKLDGGATAGGALHFASRPYSAGATTTDRALARAAADLRWGVACIMHAQAKLDGGATAGGALHFASRRAGRPRIAHLRARRAFSRGVACIIMRSPPRAPPVG